MRESLESIFKLGYTQYKGQGTGKVLASGDYNHYESGENRQN